MSVTNVLEYEGAPNVPQDVRRRRKFVQQTMKRMGTPVLIKHMYNPEDAEDGIAQKAPNWDDIYGQQRHNDPISHGVGYVSIETSANEWIHPDTGAIVVANSSPGSGYTAAPKYRGFGPGFLTYVILPDVAEDVFKLSTSGVLVRIQTAQAQMGWYPNVGDNDLLVLVTIDQRGKITDTHERYQLKQTTQISMRGRDRRGRRGAEQIDFGNQHVVNQTFELTLVPSNDELYSVETDR
jgi:hypothetical protein